MFDLADTDPACRAGHQRARGRAAVRLGSGPAARLRDLAQAGCAKAMLPRMHGRAPEVVFLNTSGGITGGDRLAYELEIGAGARAVGTTQTAERAYRAASGNGRVATRLTLGAGAVLDWLPQELILFDGAAIDRRLTVDMAADAELVMLETLVLGRAAMGERLSQVLLQDHRSVRRGGRLDMLEVVRLGPEDLARPGVAGLNGAVALATLTLMAPNAGDRLDRLRAALPADGPVRAAASAWDGRLTARFQSRDAHRLRIALAQAITTLTNRPVPRVWQI
ncbi:Urease accessory protein UreD [Roseibacterium elongatum DSM 19469]|uniref:Urease accessory protein UreD n=1 Tax=Roseicyclus elongatus DSM 19469 TaxID=1294273 RepID=W8S7B6_9RHOB|nr:urease accessory protein UreD [Roseibacterium elongatum]AHM04826.1 Urease accessory protein UreD [Roseibacterium elongatum DSM 19469]